MNGRRQSSVWSGMSSVGDCRDPKIPLLWEQGKGWERLHSSCASDDDDDFVSCADICHLLSFFYSCYMLSVENILNKEACFM